MRVTCVGCVLVALLTIVAFAVKGALLREGGEQTHAHSQEDTSANVQLQSTLGPDEASDPAYGGSFTCSDNEGFIAACANVLERHQNSQACELVYAGYLDLFGNVWACLVLGEGWAEIDIVKAQEWDTPQITRTRIESSALQAFMGDDV